MPDNFWLNVNEVRTLLGGAMLHYLPIRSPHNFPGIYNLVFGKMNIGLNIPDLGPAAALKSIQSRGVSVQLSY